MAKKPNAAIEDVSAMDADVRKMYEILKRMEETGEEDPDYGEEGEEEEELDSDDEELGELSILYLNTKFIIKFYLGTELAERLQDVDLNDANAVWSQLTESERQEFENILQSNDISQLMEVRAPWWTHKNPKPLIEEITPEPPKKNQPNADIPPICPNIPNLSQVSARPPAVCLRHNIVNVISAYSLTFRYFNGEHLNSAKESCSFLISISGSLRANANFSDDQMAIDAVLNDCSTEHIDLEDGQDALVREDVQSILDGPDGDSHQYSLAALSDVHRLLWTAKKSVSSSVPTPSHDGEFSKRFMDHQNINFDLVNRSKLSAGAKKLEFYLAFVSSGWGKC